MADLRKNCGKCGKQFRPQKGATHRKNCYACAPLRVVGDLGPPAVASEPDSAFVAAVRAELDGVGRTETADGLLLLQLAETIARGGHTASGLASLRKAYAEQRQAAFAGSEPVESAGAQVVSALFGRQ